MGAALAGPGADALVVGRHHDGALARQRVDQVEDDVVGLDPGRGEADVDAARGRAPPRLLDPVEHDGGVDADPGLELVEGVDQAPPLLGQVVARPGRHGGVVPVDQEGAARQPDQVGGGLGRVVVDPAGERRTPPPGPSPVGVAGPGPRRRRVVLVGPQAGGEGVERPGQLGRRAGGGAHRGGRRAPVERRLARLHHLRGGDQIRRLPAGSDRLFGRGGGLVAGGPLGSAWASARAALVARRSSWARWWSASRSLSCRTAPARSSASVSARAVSSSTRAASASARARRSSSSARTAARSGPGPIALDLGPAPGPALAVEGATGVGLGRVLDPPAHQVVERLLPAVGAGEPQPPGVVEIVDGHGLGHLGAEGVVVARPIGGGTGPAAEPRHRQDGPQRSRHRAAALGLDPPAHDDGDVQDLAQQVAAGAALGGPHLPSPPSGLALGERLDRSARSAPAALDRLDILGQHPRCSPPSARRPPCSGGTPGCAGSR